MKLVEKLRLIIAFLYDGKQQKLAQDLGVNRSTVTRWLDGSAIGSDYLSILYKKGVNISWLLDESDTDIKNMCANNEAGEDLRSNFLGSQFIPRVK